MSKIIDARPKAGDWVRVRTADDQMLVRRALSPDVRGHDFPVVWICRPEDYGPEHHRDAVPVGPLAEPVTGLPWPVENVWVIEPPEASNTESEAE